MSGENEIGEVRELLSKAAAILRELPDSQIMNALQDGPLDDFMNSIFSTEKVGEYRSIAEFLLANKNRGTLMARIRNAIGQNCTVRKIKNRITYYVSPSQFQFFEDAVLLLEGQ